MARNLIDLLDTSRYNPKRQTALTRRVNALPDLTRKVRMTPSKAAPPEVIEAVAELTERVLRRHESEPPVNAASEKRSVTDAVISILVRGPRFKFAWTTFLVCLLGLASVVSGRTITAAILAVAAPLFLFLAWTRGEFIR